MKKRFIIFGTDSDGRRMKVMMNTKISFPINSNCLLNLKTVISSQTNIQQIKKAYENKHLTQLMEHAKRNFLDLVIVITILKTSVTHSVSDSARSIN